MSVPFDVFLNSVVGTKITQGNPKVAQLFPLRPVTPAESKKSPSAVSVNTAIAGSLSNTGGGAVPVNRASYDNVLNVTS